MDEINDKNIEFKISEETLEKVLELKSKMGYAEKSWDDWFNFLTHQNVEKSKKDEIEMVMEKLHYQQWWDIWVQNFALNLENIWKESSARELDPTINTQMNNSNSAIVIGRGPSIEKHKHLELLASSDYKGSIICCDGALISALKNGVTPEKFPKFYVVTIDASEHIKNWYTDPIVTKHGKNIKGIFCTVAHPSAVESARKSGIKIYWLHVLFDYGEGKKSFNQISALMVRVKNHPKGLPAIQTGGNVGTSSWFIGWQILKCSTLGLIGINHGWEDNDPWDKIISHGYGHPNEVTLDKNSSTFKKLFPRIYNQEFDCYCIMDPIFQYYSSAFKEFIYRSPKWLTTINATEGGSIFGERIKCMTLEKFLKNYKN